MRLALTMSVVLIVLDGLGVGAEGDACFYNDGGADTLGTLVRQVPSPQLPTLSSLGLAKIAGGAEPQRAHAQGRVTAVGHESVGKGTTLGHWELVGWTRGTDFPICDGPIPAHVLQAVHAAIGRSTLHNAFAPSGAALVQELGTASLSAGLPILYTSSDSVIQLAAHEDSVSVDQLYVMCASIRDALEGNQAFGRVIARPFSSCNGRFVRTEGRRDFHAFPPTPNLLTRALARGLAVAAVGVICDIFSPSMYSAGFAAATAHSNFAVVAELLSSGHWDLIFTNVNDVDGLLHRKAVLEACNALEGIDVCLGGLLREHGHRHTFVITADHGCDPRSAGTDNTRELCPLFVCGRGFELPGGACCVRTLADVGQLVAMLIGVPDHAQARMAEAGASEGATFRRKPSRRTEVPE